MSSANPSDYTWSVDGETLVGKGDESSEIRFVLIPAPGVDRDGAREAVKSIARTANREARKVPLRQALLDILQTRSGERWTTSTLAVATGASISRTYALLQQMDLAGEIVIERGAPRKGHPIRLAEKATP